MDIKVLDAPQIINTADFLVNMNCVIIITKRGWALPKLMGVVMGWVCQEEGAVHRNCSLVVDDQKEQKWSMCVKAIGESIYCVGYTLNNVPINKHT